LSAQLSRTAEHSNAETVKNVTGGRRPRYALRTCCFSLVSARETLAASRVALLTIRFFFAARPSSARRIKVCFQTKRAADRAARRCNSESVSELRRAASRRPLSPNRERACKKHAIG
jgi:hypothetical protein